MYRDLVCRAAGVGLIGLGCLLAYWAVYEPLQMAQTGVSEISYRMKGVFAVPIGFVLGIAYVAGGAKADALLRQPGGQRPTMWGYVLTIGAVALGALLYWWFNQQLTGMGYVQA
ncbi:MAG: hypothetical protein Q8L23_01910 [Caulobacter sp.]|nr:hypothetical protein [Caulobacter sp.]